VNIVTQALAKRSRDRRLKDFIARWDSLEALAIRVYRLGEASPQDEAEYYQLRSWLNREYPRWQALLDSYWRQASLAGEPARMDPFAYLLGVPQAAGFANNWSALQTLPAAREAINQYLLSLPA
jgi:hypothetical protein